MPKTTAELTKELDDLKLQTALALQKLATELEQIAEANDVADKADKDIVEGLAEKIDAMSKLFEDRFDKLEAKLEAACKERLADKVNALAILIETRFKHFDDRLKEFKADTHQRRTWAISIGGAVLSTTMALVIALVIKK